MSERMREIQRKRQAFHLMGAWLLATILRQPELAIDATKEVQEKTLNEESEGFKDIHFWFYSLYAYVHWKEDMVNILLNH